MTSSSLLAPLIIHPTTNHAEQMLLNITGPNSSSPSSGWNAIGEQTSVCRHFHRYLYPLPFRLSYFLYSSLVDFDDLSHKLGDIDASSRTHTGDWILLEPDEPCRQLGQPLCPDCLAIVLSEYSSAMSIVDGTPMATG